MPITITQNSKNSLSVTNEDKGYDQTWDAATYTWDAAEGTWDTQRVIITQNSKNDLTVSNESKN